MLMTMSISSAPFWIASSVSNVFVAVVDAPNGNPITVQTSTSESASRSATYLTCVGFTHTDLKLYAFASSMIWSICVRVDSGFNKVWSIYFSNFILTTPRVI